MFIYSYVLILDRDELYLGGEAVYYYSFTRLVQSNPQRGFDVGFVLGLF